MAPQQLVPQAVLIYNKECYKKLLDKTFQCVMGFLLETMHPNEISQQLFENVCVRPQYISNFLLDLGLDFYDLHLYHSRQYFMECYASSTVYAFHHGARTCTQAETVKMQEYNKLKTKEARVRFILAWSANTNQTHDS